MNEPRVWYAAYGSNLASCRFQCYIQGGTPAGSSKHYDGCRLKSDPIKRRRHLLPFELYFACKSKSWDDAGVAFVGHQRGREHRTLARLFLLEYQQFEDVVAQEGSGRPGQVSVALDVVQSSGHQDVGDGGWYRRVLCVGELEHQPILTCTAAWDIDDERPVAPSQGYLYWVCKGLEESWGLSPTEIADYLFPVPGIASTSVTQLRSVVEQLLEHGA